jgi:hypothetical protein
MCSVSMVMDHYADKWKDWHQQPLAPQPGSLSGFYNYPTRAEFDALRKEVQDMKELVKRAVEYDKRTGQPDCETAEKVERVRKIAELVGVSLDDILPKQAEE